MYQFPRVRRQENCSFASRSIGLCVGACECAVLCVGCSLYRFFVFVFLQQIFHCRTVFFYACAQRSSVCAVRDCGAVSCPQTRKLERDTTLEYPLKPLWHIHFVSVSLFIFLVIFFHFCCIVFLSVRLGRQALL